MSIQTFFIFLTTDIRISFISSINTFGIRFFLLLNFHSYFLFFAKALNLFSKFSSFHIFFVIMPSYTSNAVRIRSLLLMSSYLTHIAFSLNFLDAAQYIYYSFLKTVVLTVELTCFPKTLVKHVIPSHHQQFLSINPSL